MSSRIDTLIASCPAWEDFQLLVSNQKIDKEKYLRICEQLGQEPDPSKMPLEVSEFPEDVQVAFFMHDLLSDKWDGMSGHYLGKDWTQCQHLFELYDIEKRDRVNMLYFMKMYEAQLEKTKAEENERKRKADERKQQTAGKKYTHNVRG